MPDRPDQARIVFTPSGRQGTTATGASVLDAARVLGVDLDSVCGGKGICGRCQVTPVDGDFPKHGIVSAGDHLSAFSTDEKAYRVRKGLEPGRRLGCLAIVGGDVVIDVPPESQLHRQVVRKRLEVRDFTVDPVLRLYYVVAPEADTGMAFHGLADLLDALREQWGLVDLEPTDGAIRDASAALLSGDGSVTIAVRDGSVVVAVWPGFRDVALGIAFDVGSTTLAGHLCDLFSGDTLASAGSMNPQIRFGEDLMSRVSHVMMHPEGAQQMTSVVRDALDDLVGELVSTAGVVREDVLEFTLVGNPIMHHLVFGFDVRPLGVSPFTLETSRSIDIVASELGLSAHEAARLHALPCIAGHVGADTAAAILSEAPNRSDAMQLIVDVGTNAEIVLGNKDRILAASSPTGPAFEGAQISSGQRATPGAIERVRIDTETFEPRFSVVGSPVWSDEENFTGIDSSGICGSGIIEAVAELYLSGLVMPDGRFADDAPRRSARVVPDGRTFSYRLTRNVSVTQADVRAIQLAKAALSAGIRLLMTHMGIESVGQIRLAGAFGSHIDPLYAMVIGLIPDCDLDDVSAAGNAAGAGAVMALLDRSSRASIDEVVVGVERIETATESRFQDYFVESMAFPHRTDPYPELSQLVHLARSVDDGRSTRRRRGRSRRPL
ncbi:MAG: ASKHA domain-containing protein [Acidimicrobiia bacterium]|nr:MAG: ASKHA domain-containing protein [Acidimicrobiia bacterium]